VNTKYEIHITTLEDMDNYSWCRIERTRAKIRNEVIKQCVGTNMDKSISSKVVMWISYFVITCCHLMDGAHFSSSFILLLEFLKGKVYAVVIVDADSRCVF
jgi:hypothetical protein